MLLVAGGVIPDEDVPALRDAGVAEVILQDTPPDAIVARSPRAWSRPRAPADELMPGDPSRSTAVSISPVRRRAAWTSRSGRRATTPRTGPPPTPSTGCPRSSARSPAARDALILAKLRQQVRYAWERSPFYRRKWEDGGRVARDARKPRRPRALPGGAEGRAARRRRRRTRPSATTSASSRGRGGAHPRHQRHHRAAHRVRHRAPTTGSASARRTRASCGAPASARATAS